MSSIEQLALPPEFNSSHFVKDDIDEDEHTRMDAAVLETWGSDVDVNILHHSLRDMAELS